MEPLDRKPAVSAGGMRLENRIQAVRAFNRFYTRQIGVLQEGLVGSPFSLAESRVLYELAHRDRPTAGELAKDLDLDPGYLSRMLRGFARQRLVARQQSPQDGRQSHLALTPGGRRAAKTLDRGSQMAVRAMLQRLSPAEQERLVGACGAVRTLLGDRSVVLHAVPYILRPPQPGDMGWVVERHGAVYAQEYGYDRTFEGLVASVVGEFVARFDAERERCWIAEKDGVNVGSIFLVRKSDRVAKLRLLIVEPAARGLGIGARLVAECVRFARQVGYRAITLWTHGHLRAARHLYREAGFRMVRRTPVHSFGRDLVDEIWEKTL